MDWRLCPGVCLYCDCSSHFSLEGDCCLLRAPRKPGHRRRYREPLHAPPLCSSHHQTHTCLYTYSESLYHLRFPETSHPSHSLLRASLSFKQQDPQLLLMLPSKLTSSISCQELEVKVQIICNTGSMFPKDSICSTFVRVVRKCMILDSWCISWEIQL